MHCYFSIDVPMDFQTLTVLGPWKSQWAGDWPYHTHFHWRTTRLGNLSTSFFSLLSEAIGITRRFRKLMKRGMMGAMFDTVNNNHQLLIFCFRCYYFKELLFFLMGWCRTQSNWY
jgi:hypothetical protein